MQIRGLHKNIYKLSNYTLSQEKLTQHQKKYAEPVNAWKKLKSENVSDATCQDILKISRATFYRYHRRLRDLSKGILPPTKRPHHLRKHTWGEAEKKLILRLRRENPTYGKAKIAILLGRDHGLRLSESTVGRILKHMMNKGFVTKSMSAPRMKRKRRFSKGHAQKWRYGLKAQKPGQMVQIDHMSVYKNQLSLKHFQAWDPTSKFIHANVYCHATSRTAKAFLIELIERAPFEITSIQVDGGSEFMKEFEDACCQLGIALFVLPPKRPQYNGGVERGNRILREEFYDSPRLLADSFGAIRFELHRALHKYNTYRPHFSLKGNTPLGYIQNVLLKEAA